MYAVRSEGIDPANGRERLDVYKRQLRFRVLFLGLVISRKVAFPFCRIRLRKSGVHPAWGTSCPGGLAPVITSLAGSCCQYPVVQSVERWLRCV